LRRYVACRYCGTRNDRTGGRRKCAACRQPLPKRRVPKHAETLRDDSYEYYVLLNSQIHVPVSELDPEVCGICGRARPESRRHDRDHDHRTGQPRGLACVRCNRELLRNATLEEARLVVAYLERVEAFYAAERDAGERPVGVVAQMQAAFSRMDAEKQAMLRERAGTEGGQG
jgi:hypothetical protein